MYLGYLQVRRGIAPINQLGKRLASVHKGVDARVGGELHVRAGVERRGRRGVIRGEQVRDRRPVVVRDLPPGLPQKPGFNLRCRPLPGQFAKKRPGRMGLAECPTCPTY